MSSAAELLASLALAGVPNFAPPADVVFPLRQFPTQPALADFDADGRPDLLVPGRNSDGLVFVLKGVEGGFALGRGGAVAREEAGCRHARSHQSASHSCWPPAQCLVAIAAD